MHKLSAIDLNSNIQWAPSHFGSYAKATTGRVTKTVVNDGLTALLVFCSDAGELDHNRELKTHRMRRPIVHADAGVVIPSPSV